MLKCTFTRETLREDDGPNAVSVNRLTGCWSIIQLRQEHFCTKVMLLSVIFLDKSYGH